MVDVRMRVRDGNRGGQEQFRWDSIKDQDFKDREQYLGGSTKVGQMGKMGKYVQHDWYIKKRETTTSIQDERRSIQAYEEELMQEALGLRPKKLLLAKRELTEGELKEFLAKEKSEGKQGREQLGGTKEQKESAAAGKFEDRGQEARGVGLGYAPHRTAKLEQFKADTLGIKDEMTGSTLRMKEAALLKYGDQPKGEEAKPEEGGVKQEVKEEVHEDTDNRQRASSSGGVAELKQDPVKSEPLESGALAGKRKHGDSDGKDKKSKKEAKKRKKIEKKAAKKQVKKEKKAAKKAHKSAKHGRRKKSSSSGSSTSDNRHSGSDSESGR